MYSVYINLSSNDSQWHLIKDKLSLDMAEKLRQICRDNLNPWCIRITNHLTGKNVDLEEVHGGLFYNHNKKGRKK
jgi:hypothetical protein